MSENTPTAALPPRTAEELRQHADNLLNRFDLQRVILSPPQQHIVAPLAVPDGTQLVYRDHEITNSNDVRELWTFWRSLLPTDSPPPEPPALIQFRGEAVAAIRSFLDALKAILPDDSEESGCVVYPLPRITADSLPPDLRDSCEAAWKLVGCASVFVHWLKSAIDPILTGTVKAIEGKGTPQERIVSERPPIFTVTGQQAAEALADLDEAYQLCAERVRLVRNDLIAHGDGVYLDGEFHAACAHDATMEYARSIRQDVDLLIRIAPGGRSGSWEHFVPATALRDNWDSVLQVFRSLPNKFDKLPSAGRLQSAILREAVKTSAARVKLNAHDPRSNPIKGGGATQVADATPTPEAPSDAAKFARFLELHALATAPGKHQVPSATLDEYQRLLTRFGVYTVDCVFVGPLDPTRVPNSDPIFNTDCIPLPGTKPLVCPRSAPKLPVELLPQVEARFRSLRLVDADKTVLWVGRQARMETLCMYRNGCDCFTASLPPSSDVNRGGEGEKPQADPYADLRRFARSDLKGQERAVIDALCDAGGELPIKDLAVKDGVDWDDPKKGFKYAQDRLNGKLKSLNWRLIRQDNAAKLISLEGAKEARKNAP